MKDGDRVQDAQGRRGTVVQVRVHTLGRGTPISGATEPMVLILWDGSRNRAVSYREAVDVKEVCL